MSPVGSLEEAYSLRVATLVSTCRHSMPRHLSHGLVRSLWTMAALAALARTSETDLGGAHVDMWRTSMEAALKITLALHLSIPSLYSATSHSDIISLLFAVEGLTWGHWTGTAATAAAFL